MHTRRTGTDYKSCQLFLFDRFVDLLLSSLGTHICIVLRMDNTRLMRRHLHNFLYVYRTCDIRSAVADKYSNPLHLLSPPVSSECTYEQLLRCVGIKQFRHLIR